MLYRDVANKNAFSVFQVNGITENLLSQDDTETVVK